MHRPRSKAHKTVLWTCVLGCVWVALSDEKVAPRALPADPMAEVRAATIDELDTPRSPVQPDHPRAFLGSTPAAQGEDLTH